MSNQNERRCPQSTIHLDSNDGNDETGGEETLHHYSRSLEQLSRPRASAREAFSGEEGDGLARKSREAG